MTDVFNSTSFGFKQIPIAAGILGLIGGAEFTEDCSFDSILIERSNTKEISVIPAAAAFENPTKVISNASDYFKTFGVKVNPIMILNRNDAFNPSVIAQINDSNFIYIPGGSPLHLKSVLKDSPAFEAIIDKWHNGASLVGSSAGAMVLGDPMIDPRGGAYTVGLKLLSNLTVIPHFNGGHPERISRSLKFAPKNTVIVGLDEKTAVIRNSDSTWETMGKGNSYFYLNSQQKDISVLN
jgi:cyanophycinase